MEGQGNISVRVKRHRASITVAQLSHSLIRLFSLGGKICIHSTFGAYQTSYFGLFCSFPHTLSFCLVARYGDPH